MKKKKKTAAKIKARTKKPAKASSKGVQGAITRPGTLVPDWAR